MDYPKAKYSVSTTISATRRPSLDAIGMSSTSYTDDSPLHSSHSQPFPFTSYSHNRTSRMGDSTFGDGSKARKGSIRNAVRKIFGKRATRDMTPQIPKISFSGPGPQARHTYHRSEPLTMLTHQPTVPEHTGEDVGAMERTLSDFIEAPPRHSQSRTASPYALQFPNSSRLKPMDLGTPFIQPDRQLRRRKTLPSMLIEEKDGHATLEETADLRTHQLVGSVHTTPERKAAARSASVKKAWRKSRSTDDIHPKERRAHVRKRSEEIRYWRESFQPDVTRASAPVYTVEEEEQPADVVRPGSPQGSARSGSTQEYDDATPVPHIVEPCSLPAQPDSSTSRQGAQSGLSANPTEFRRSAEYSTDLSRDLEDRVSRLEAGLHDFQRSLQKLTADRNRRTIVMGGSAGSPRASTDMRSPSFLADTLADPLEWSSYEYEYGHTLRQSVSSTPQHSVRPSTSSRRVRSRTSEHRGRNRHGSDALGISGITGAPSGRTSEHHRHTSEQHRHTSEHHRHTSEQHRHTSERHRHTRAAPSEPRQMPTPPEKHTSAATMAAITPGTNNGSSKETPLSQPPQHTFRSLYEMLADERSARRRLESQLRGLRQDITDLHHQVTTSSQFQSTRSSYLIAGSSSRLQDLLRETGESSPLDENSDEHEPPFHLPSSPPVLPTSYPATRTSTAAQRRSDLSSSLSLVIGSAPVVSRFSGSDSEALSRDFYFDEDDDPVDGHGHSHSHGHGHGPDVDDVDPSSLHAYRPPREDRSAWAMSDKLDRPRVRDQERYPARVSMGSSEMF